MVYTKHLLSFWDSGICILDKLGVLLWLVLFHTLSQLIAGGFKCIWRGSTLEGPLEAWA